MQRFVRNELDEFGNSHYYYSIEDPDVVLERLKELNGYLSKYQKFYNQFIKKFQSNRSEVVDARNSVTSFRDVMLKVLEEMKKTRPIYFKVFKQQLLETDVDYLYIP